MWELNILTWESWHGIFISECFNRILCCFGLSVTEWSLTVDNTRPYCQIWTEGKPRNRSNCEQDFKIYACFEVLCCCFAVSIGCVWEISLLHAAVMMSSAKHERASVWFNRHVSEIAFTRSYWILHLKRLLCWEYQSIDRQTRCYGRRVLGFGFNHIWLSLSRRSLWSNSCANSSEKFTQLQANTRRKSLKLFHQNLPKRHRKRACL